MLFNTLDYAGFLLGVLALYRALPHRAQNAFLLLASYAFYAVWDARFLGLLALSTVVDFGVGRGLAATSRVSARRALLGASLVVNLGLLGLFKYFDFFAESLAGLLRTLGLDVPGVALGLVLPVGISFYTFQTLSYSIDVYAGRVVARRSLLDFALYVSFFPQLVAGPIERPGRLLPQIEAPRRVTPEGFRSGAWLVLWGLFQKVVVADNLGHLADAVYGAEAPTSWEAALGVYAFTLQLYCDFSGYTDVARGTARLLGFELQLNFDLPFLATTTRDFWRRWHISLSSWLRDYVYIPLGGSRGSRLATYRNLGIAVTLIGMWHGAGWTFVAFGVHHAVALIAYQVMAPFLDRWRPARRGIARGAWLFLGWAVTFHSFALSMTYFRAESLAGAGRILRALASPPEVGLALQWLPTFLLLAAPLALMHAWQGLRRDLEVVLRAPFAVRVLVYVLLLAGILLLGEDHGQPFIYFQF